MLMPFAEGGSAFARAGGRRARKPSSRIVNFGIRLPPTFNPGGGRVLFCGSREDHVRSARPLLNNSRRERSGRPDRLRGAPEWHPVPLGRVIMSVIETNV